MDNRAFFWFRATSVIGANCDYLGKIRKQSWAALEMWESQISQIFQSSLFCSPTFKVTDCKIIKRCCQDPQNKQSRAKTNDNNNKFRGVLPTDPRRQLFPWLGGRWHRCRGLRGTVTLPEAPARARAQRTSDFTMGFTAPESAEVAFSLAGW